MEQLRMSVRNSMKFQYILIIFIVMDSTIDI